MRLPKLVLVIFVSLFLSACTFPWQKSNKIITLYYWGLFDSATTINEIVEDYKKVRPNVNIVYDKKSREQYRETLQTQIAAGKGPDIFQFHNTWMLMVQKDLTLVPTDVFSLSDFKDNFYPTVITDLRNSQKKFVGVPIGIDGLSLYYNEELFQAAGIAAPPATWQEFAQDAIRLTVRDTAGNIRTAGAALGTSVNVDYFSDILALMVLQNGGDLKNPVNQRSYDALDYYTHFAKGQNRVWDETMPSSALAFAGGNLAMYFGPSTKAADIKNTKPLLKFKIVPVPQLEGGKVAWASYWAIGVSANLKDKEAQDEAWRFVKYLQDDQTMVKLYSEAAKDPAKLVGLPYPKINLGQKLATDPIVGAYITDAPYMRSFPMAANTFDNGLNDQIIKAYAEAIKANLSGTPANRSLEPAAKVIQNVFTKYTSPKQ